MKARAIVKIVICSLLVVVLTTALILGLQGRNFSFPFGFYVSWDDKDEASFSVGSATLEGYVTELKVEWLAGSVTVKYHEGEEIIIREPEMAEERDRLRYKLEGTTLTIYACKSGRSATALEDKPLEILLPGGPAAPLYACDIETVSADIYLEGIEAAEAALTTVSGMIHLNQWCNFGEGSIETVSGTVKTEDFTASELKTESVSGEIQLSGVVLDAQIETMSGDVTMVLTNEHSVLEVNTVSGDWDLTLPSDANFRIAADGIGDDLQIVGFVYELDDGEYVIGDHIGKANVQFDTVSGDIIIRAADAT